METALILLSSYFKFTVIVSYKLVHYWNLDQDKKENIVKY